MPKIPQVSQFRFLSDYLQSLVRYSAVCIKENEALERGKNKNTLVFNSANNNL